MTTDNQFLQQLLATFNVELDSLLSIISTNLQKMKNSDSTADLNPMSEEISRAGRNINVSAQAVGLDDVGAIAKCVEQLFIPGKKISPERINLASQAVHEMQLIAHLFMEKKEPSPEFSALLSRLRQQLHDEEQNEEDKEFASNSMDLLTDSLTTCTPDNLLSSSLDPADKPRDDEMEEGADAKSTSASFITPSPALTVSASNNEEDVFFKTILETFKTELQDNLILMTQNLMLLEKGEQSESEVLNLFKEVFRMAHNIKGSARGIGAMHVGDIAHHIETLFSAMQKKKLRIASPIINLCLQSIDFMNEAMRCYSEKIPLSFNLQNHLDQLEYYIQQDPTDAFSESVPLATPERAAELLDSSILSSIPNSDDTLKSFDGVKKNEFESIRVALQNLDRVSAYMEEIQASKIAIEEHYYNLTKINFKLQSLVQSEKKHVPFLTPICAGENDYSNKMRSKYLAELFEINNAIHWMHKELRKPVNEMSALLNTLQDEIRMLRLIPVDNQLRNLPRIVRDLANELGKKVNLEIKNNNVKMDKMILDGLKDPIVHILRNAIDHGIETAEIRQAAGKSAQGNITIEVNQQGNQIIFKISDDGAGINRDDLIRSALKKNIITQAELNEMTPDAVYDLLFRPGFSTREIVTDISGRGIGLDVVRSNLIRLKGHVSLESQLGRGTQFFLQVPLTLATERGLFFLCNNQVFVLITHAIDSVLLLKKRHLVKVEGSCAVLVNEQPVLLCSLSKILHLAENMQHEKEQLSIIILKEQGKCIALEVDEILGEKEIVLKPLQEPLTNLPFVVGATLTGGNQINFILNPSEIIKKAQL